MVLIRSSLKWLSKIKNVEFLALLSSYIRFIVPCIDGNKTKKANLKTGVTRKQSTPNFWKNKHFLPTAGYEMFIFR